MPWYVNNRKTPVLIPTFGHVEPGEVFSTDADQRKWSCYKAVPETDVRVVLAKIKLGMISEEALEALSAPVSKPGAPAGTDPEPVTPEETAAESEAEAKPKGPLPSLEELDGLGYQQAVKLLKDLGYNPDLPGWTKVRAWHKAQLDGG